MRPRALLLDFDGVILQSAELKSRAFAELYRDEGDARVAQVIDFVERNGGVTRRDKLAHIERRLFGRSPVEDEIDALAARFRERVFERVVASDFVPGAQRLLALSQGRIAMHVISGTPHEELQQVVDRRALRKWFASVDGAPPDKRTTFSRLLARHGYRPEDTLAIGDAPTEYEAAVDLGIPFLAVVPRGARNRFPVTVSAVTSLEPLPALLGLLEDVPSATLGAGNGAR
jgi:phosphoglycolate phosphatase-like HAD superfamily hydrolase